MALCLVCTGRWVALVRVMVRGNGRRHMDHHDFCFDVHLAMGDGLCEWVEMEWVGANAHEWHSMA